MQLQFEWKLTHHLRWFNQNGCFTSLIQGYWQQLHTGRTGKIIKG